MKFLRISRNQAVLYAASLAALALVAPTLGMNVGDVCTSSHGCGPCKEGSLIKIDHSWSVCAPRFISCGDYEMDDLKCNCCSNLMGLLPSEQCIPSYLCGE